MPAAIAPQIMILYPLSNIFEVRSPSHLIILVVIHEWMLLIYLTLLAQSLEIDQNGGPVDILIDNKRVFTVESEYLGSLSSSLDEVLKNIREGDNHIRIAQDGSEISYTVNIPNTRSLR